MDFSPRQQQILSLAFIVYGVWILAVAGVQAHKTPVTAPLAQPDPPDVAFYIDPPVQINAAIPEELQLLPGIGPVLATRIIAYREQHGAFTSLRALQQVHGIGPKTLEKLQHYLTLPDE
ncbi:helix-hairpin-helix domain-containing protein [candidate division KSB3 bacterium]|uniref:Helix-hairpin-helix domain-containing protein n=1 Tax=candidate division KSB3 bacterium TaxID=2044937 RepID=A0A9D5Q4B6_9BACT|nr:helix-hairpin-helix domain-containing protein [candidate division KSB3 bacterium]MBD3323083.1 helix-hairpin-helix domain-containing protein [candidate division KSB3 bacterium]